MSSPRVTLGIMPSHLVDTFFTGLQLAARLLGQARHREGQAYAVRLKLCILLLFLLSIWALALLKTFSKLFASDWLHPVSIIISLQLLGKCWYWSVWWPRIQTQDTVTDQLPIGQSPDTDHRWHFSLVKTSDWSLLVNWRQFVLVLFYKEHSSQRSGILSILLFIGVKNYRLIKWSSAWLCKIKVFKSVHEVPIYDFIGDNADADWAAGLRQACCHKGEYNLVTF